MPPPTSRPRPRCGRPRPCSGGWAPMIFCSRMSATRCGSESPAGAYIENPDEIRALLGRADPQLLKFCLDTGHVAFGGGDPVEIARTYAPRIGYVHLKDINLRRLHALLAEGHDYTATAQQDVFVA